jgi:hypothetical protein
MKEEAKKEGYKIVIKPSNFMDGICVFKLPKNESLPPYIEPNKKYKNGDETYKKYNVAWMMKIGEKCDCD